MRLDEITNAAKEASARTSPDGTPAGPPSQVREIILRELGEAPLEGLDVDEVVRTVSMTVQKRIEEMIWPQRRLEVKRRMAQAEVDREAHIVEIVRETLHLLRSRNG